MVSEHGPTLAGSWETESICDIWPRYASIMKPGYFQHKLLDFLARTCGKRTAHLRFDCFLSTMRIYRPRNGQLLGEFPLDGTVLRFPHPFSPGAVSVRCILRSHSHLAFEVTYPAGYGKARWD